MVTRIAVVLFLGFLFTPACHVSADLKSDMLNAPPEKQLAYLNSPNSDWYHLDSQVVARFRSLLSQLSQEYRSTPKEIADWTVKLQSVVEQKGVQETLLSLMEAVNRATADFPQVSASYRDMSTAYVTLRVKGYSRQEAIEGVQAFYLATLKGKPSR